MAPHTKKREPLSKEGVKQKLRERKKNSKQLLKSKRARLVVTNLPFKATEENLKEYFQQYGEVENVELLKKQDGKLVGCGFIQFKLVQKAAKARFHVNGKEFLGRKVVVDFAKPKNKYEKAIKNEVQEEPSEVIEIKEEQDDDNKEDCSFATIVKTDGEQTDSGDENDEDIEDSENEMKVEHERPDKKPHVISNDVTEGKTVFVKNLPFDACNDDLKECMKQFGPIYYALICIDKFTEHSKGTGFVKFVNKEDADKALNAGTELTLLGNVLDCHPALNKSEVQQNSKDKISAKKEPKDSRNLYLVKEGVILAGSKAAQGVSASDMAKRLQIEQYKTQMLRNLNMFVAKDRLVIHNLPSSWDDKKLRILMQKYGGEGAVVKEARLMRDMRNLDANGIGKSKEYGFVSYTKHEHALQALRSLNNNPDIFSPHKRPILTFSIENKIMINARLKRLEKSKMYNPTNKNFQGKNHKQKSENKTNTSNNQSIKRGNANKNWHNNKANDSDALPKFSGVSSEPGAIQKMRSRYKLTTQAKIHHENLKKEKRKQKNAKKTLAEKKKEFIKQPKQKIKKIKESDDFSKLVSSYKKTLLSASAAKKSKWYE